MTENTIKGWYWAKSDGHNRYYLHLYNGSVWLDELGTKCVPTEIGERIPSNDELLAMKIDIGQGSKASMPVIDWDDPEIPDSIVAFAFDEDGRGFFYTEIPALNIDDGDWDGKTDYHYTLKNWQDSLQLRPKKLTKGWWVLAEPNKVVLIKNNSSGHICAHKIPELLDDRKALENFTPLTDVEIESFKRGF